MTTLRGKWLVPILMSGMCFSFQGPPARPSTPECHIPCDDKRCGVDIICTWDSKPDLNNNLTYTLYWNSSESSSSSSSHNGIIQRPHFTIQSELQVWVQAQNQHGVAKSEPYVFNTADISKPPPPDITSSSQDPMEIHWSSFCDQLMLSAGDCEVRYRTEAEEAWTPQDEGGVSGSHILEDPQPNTNYLFQVRCNCSPGLMSNWSEVHTIRSAEKAPVGKLDVWTDCGILPTSSDCVLTWKKLPMFQARGHILGYNVTLFYNNGTNMPLNESAAQPVSLLVCGEVQCYLNTSLKDVTSISISAYNALGFTAPFHLDMPVRVKMPNEEALHLEMKENICTVSWHVPSWISDSIKEYVVQYKQADCPLGHGFDWVRVNKSQAVETIKGQFKKYTAYQVSVFTVSDHKKEQFFLSDIAHFVQGKPAKVPLFKVLSYGTTHVELLWEPVLLSKQNGVTPYYQIGAERHKVYNVSAYPQLENRTFKVTDLTEDQNYELWIKAVTQAGSGPNTTVLFKTLHNENIGPLILGLLGILFIVIIIIVFCLFFSRENKACSCVPSFFYEKVPDPHNSNIIKQMKHQMNDSLAWICIPVLEQQPIISVIEIVDVPPCALNSQSDKTTTFARLVSEDRADAQEDPLREDCNRTPHRYGKQEYSKMVDSDEETNREEEESVDNLWSSEDDNFSSGYERHFMPTVSEIMNA